MSLISPDVNLEPSLRVRALDGRTYDVRTRADVRVMAADMYRLASAYQEMMRVAEDRLRVPATVEAERMAWAWYASVQASTGDMLRFVGQLYATGDPSWASRPDLRLRPVVIDGVTYALDTPSSLETVGARMTAKARAAWESLGLRQSAPVTASEQLTDWIPEAHAKMQALPVAYAAGLWVIGIIAGALTVVAVVQASLSWYAPEGTARLEAYQQGLDAIEDYYARQLDRCGQLTGEARTRCEAEALDTTLEQLDRINTAARPTWVETLKKVALVVTIGSVALAVFRPRPGGRA